MSKPTIEPQQATDTCTASSWDDLHVGDRVELIRAGHPEGHAVIDALMPDGTALWVWRDNGMGRTMILPGDDLRLSAG